MSDVEVIHGDCREILPTLPVPDAIVTDPPYGIDFVHSGKGAPPALNRTMPQRNSAPIEGDGEPFDPSHLIEHCPNVLLWGANHYARRLPEAGRWLAWYKV